VHTGAGHSSCKRHTGRRHAERVRRTALARSLQLSACCQGPELPQASVPQVVPPRVPLVLGATPPLGLRDAVQQGHLHSRWVVPCMRVLACAICKCKVVRVMHVCWQAAGARQGEAATGSHFEACFEARPSVGRHPAAHQGGAGALSDVGAVQQHSTAQHSTAQHSTAQHSSSAAFHPRFHTCGRAARPGWPSPAPGLPRGPAAQHSTAQRVAQCIG
jgi:hypothetical protein